jgi:hypothetical protein
MVQQFLRPLIGITRKMSASEIGVSAVIGIAASLNRRNPSEAISASLAPAQSSAENWVV